MAKKYDYSKGDIFEISSWKDSLTIAHIKSGDMVSLDEDLLRGFIDLISENNG